MSKHDDRPPLDRALEAAAGLRVGTWEGVESLSVLAIAADGRPERAQLLTAARDAAAGLKAGTWDAVRALAWLARAEQEIAGS